MMKKVVLVDDEIEVREGIRNCINWEKEGFLYCGDAPDGELALPLIEREQPDIVITDIKMPFMDGIELSRIVRKKMPTTKIIILSGHDQFEYAREALRIQITEYCLKPLNATDLLSLLNKISKQVDAEQEERARLNELKNKVHENAILSRNQFLLELCEGTYSTSAAIKEASKFDIDIISNFYMVIIIEAKRELQNVMNRLHHLPTLHFNRHDKEAIYIIKGEKKQQLEGYANLIRHTLEKSVNARSSTKAVFGIGQVKSRIKEIATSYQEAYVQYHDNHTLHGAIPLETFKPPFNRYEVQQFLAYGQIEEVDKFSTYITTFLNEENQQNSFIYYYFLMEFTATIKNYLEKINSNYTQNPIISSMRQLEFQHSIHDRTQIKNYIANILTHVIQFRNQTKSKNYPLIEKAKVFIQEHFADSQLSLQQIAKIVNISPSYFSHIFSQEEGQTIKEYITSMRIEKAKELLITTNEKTYEIALKVGYSDSHYFCHMFKKVTGMTTREFKRKGLMIENDKED